MEIRMRNKNIKLGYKQNKNDFEAEPVNLVKFKEYLEKYGPERAQGYFDAIIDMSKNIDTLFYHYDSKFEMYRCGTPHNVKSHLTEFKEQTDDLIDEVTIGDLVQNKPKIEPGTT
jgi:hypothetical protein